MTTVMGSQVMGTSGLTLTGGGSLRLTNALNSYTGTTSIRNGSLFINSEASLGGTGAVSILTSNSTPANTNLIGFGGGSLVLDGTAGGFTFSRAINFEGRGPIGDRGAAIQSLGNNTLSGVLTSAVSPLSPATVRNSRINSVNGTLTVSGTLNVGGTPGTTITSRVVSIRQGWVILVSRAAPLPEPAPWKNRVRESFSWAVPPASQASLGQYARLLQASASRAPYG